MNLTPFKTTNYEQTTTNNASKNKPKQTQSVVSLPALPVLSLPKGARSNRRIYFRPQKRSFALPILTFAHFGWPKALMTVLESASPSKSVLKKTQIPAEIAPAEKILCSDFPPISDIYIRWKLLSP